MTICTKYFCRPKNKMKSHLKLRCIDDKLCKSYFHWLSVKLFFCMHCIAENPMKSSLSDFWISEFSKSTATAKQSSTIAVGIYTLSRCFYEWIRWHPWLFKRVVIPTGFVNITAKKIYIKNHDNLYKIFLPT
jgi:hypothetical protein